MAETSFCEQLRPNSDVDGPGVVIAIVAQSIGSLVLCAIYCLIHRKYREKWEHYPWTANFNAALFKLLMDLSNTMIILVLGLVVGAFVTRHRTTAYHLRMVAYLATLNTYAVILIQYFTWWTGSVRIRRQRQRVLYLIIIVSAWAVSLGFGIWKTKDRLEREENCLSNKTDVGIPVAWSVYIVLIQAGLLLFFAVVTDPLRRWRDSKYGDAARGTILRPKTSTKWKIGIVTFLLCGVPLTPSYGYYRFVVICQCIAFIIMDLYFIALWRGHYSELFGEEQNAWGMGQVLSLVLLLIPLTEFVFSLRPIGTVERSFSMYTPQGYRFHPEPGLAFQGMHSTRPNDTEMDGSPRFGGSEISSNPANSNLVGGTTRH